MNHTRLWTSAAIIALVIIVGFALSVPHTRDLPRPPESETAPTVPTVTIHDSFKKGLHTITGSLTAANPCTIATATASFVGSASSTQSLSAQAGILLTISMPEDTGICLQEPARVKFSTIIKADASVPIQATVNDVAATTTAS